MQKVNGYKPLNVDTGRFQCILFDSDGTLVDSEPLTFEILSDQLELMGLLLDPESIHLRFRGWNLGEAFQVISEEHNLELPADFERLFRAYQQEQFESRLQPIPGVAELLPQLDQDMAVVTSGPMPKVRKALQVTRLADYFGERIYSAHEVGIWKPDPGIYLHAAEDMGYSIEQCIAIEDSPIGLQAAVESGIQSVFLNRFGDTCDNENVIQIRSMSELPAILSQP